MKIPKRLKLGGHVMTVEKIDPATIPAALVPEFIGRWDTRAATLTIMGGQSESCEAVTFLHEILEAVSALYELELEHPKISALAEHLFQVLRDNRLDFGKGG